MLLESKTVVRSVIRKAKLTGLAHRIRMLWHRDDYEDRFADLMLRSIQPQDCVWDIGANVGYYTGRFSQIAARVIAFEPISENCEAIRSRQMPNVQCVETALGDKSGKAPMFVAGQFSSMVQSPSPEAPQRSVPVVRGDDLTSLQMPTVVKIDVEGFEREVVRGMERTLGGARAVFVEVHFQVLEERGMKHAPSALVQDLKRLGFAKIVWPDASHLAAFRN